MFATCLHCHGALGANEEIEGFPVGRKLAFDGARGRLWVVCPGCARWNLTPLEERWESIEQCERLFRDTPLRASTDHIGLARARSGLQLVRVGAPSRPEFAAWRYGHEFARRRRRTLVLAGMSLSAMAGSAALRVFAPEVAASIPLFGVLPQVGSMLRGWEKGIRPVARVPYEGRDVTLRRSDLQNVTLELDAASPSGWRLNVLHARGRTLLDGGAAERVLTRMLTRVNGEGGSAKTVELAVRSLASVGTAQEYLRHYAAQGRGAFTGHSWRQEHVHQVLALEMALHEDTERVALEGDLAALETAWREAEEIAAIADTLLIPEGIQRRLQQWRGRG